jgi:hypothetical protein
VIDVVAIEEWSAELPVRAVAVTLEEEETLLGAGHQEDAVGHVMQTSE